MLTEEEKYLRPGKLLLVLIIIFVIFRIGFSWGQNNLLTDLNERGELTCESEYCTLYLEGSDLEIGGISDFEISRTY